MKLLMIFIAFNALNVVIQTIKSIATIKCGKTMAAIVNAIAYGLYTYIVVLTVCDLPLWEKILVVALCNFVGVWVVKYVEEKMRKDKLWKVEATIYAHNTAALDIALTECHIPHNYINAGKYSIFNCYCATQEESRQVKKALDEIGAKFFVSESKTLA
jgi:uncharacterized protein YebE (UPF0316 family)